MRSGHPDRIASHAGFAIHFLMIAGIDSGGSSLTNMRNE